VTGTATKNVKSPMSLQHQRRQKLYSAGIKTLLKRVSLQKDCNRILIG